MGEGGFKIWVHGKHLGKDQGMTRVKVITVKHTIKDGVTNSQAKEEDMTKGKIGKVQISE